MAVKTAKPSLSPYNQADLDGAQAIVDSADQVIELYDRCISCGMDFQPLRDQAEALKAWAQEVINQFGPISKGNPHAP